MYLPPGPRRHVVDSLKRRGVMTVDQLSVELALSRTATRAHLLTLEGRGFIERVKVENSGAGRPPLGFRLTGKAEGLFPDNDGEVLTKLLGFLVEGGREELIHDFFSRIWEDRTREFHDELDDAEMPELADRIRALKTVMTRGNFMPVIETPDGGADGDPAEACDVIVTECNCPMQASVRATRIPCKYEREFIEMALDGKVNDHNVDGSASPQCVFCVDVNGHVN